MPGGDHCYPRHHVVVDLYRLTAALRKKGSGEGLLHVHVEHGDVPDAPGDGPSAGG
ncbi:MAG: hypothetical protein ABDH61_03620 [Acidilobaceae archaeon]